MLTDMVHDRGEVYQVPDYDGLWKKVIQDLFAEFMLFFAPSLHEEIDYHVQPEFLQQELFKEILQERKGKNVADQIVKVRLKNGNEKWVYIHIEVQDKVSQDFSKRMFRYFYRIYDKFDKEVYAIALMTNEQSQGYPAHFHYQFFGTILDYTYNIYRFHDHTVAELEQSNNPFALAIIAGKYASKYKNDAKMRYHFKLKLMKQVLAKFPQDKGDMRLYLSALFYFIDYILKVPQEDEYRLRMNILTYHDKGGEVNMQEENEEILSPTLRFLVNKVQEEEVRKAEKRGIEQGHKNSEIRIAKELIKDGFSIGKTSRLTGLSEEEVEDIIKIV